MRVEKELFRSDGRNRFAFVDVLDELRDETVGELNAELREIFAGLGKVVTDHGNGLF